MKIKELKAQLERLQASKMKVPAVKRAILNLEAMIRGEISYAGDVTSK